MGMRFVNHTANNQNMKAGKAWGEGSQWLLTSTSACMGMQPRYVQRFLELYNYHKLHACKSVCGVHKRTTAEILQTRVHPAPPIPLQTWHRYASVSLDPGPAQFSVANFVRAWGEPGKGLTKFTWFETLYVILLTR